MMVPPRPGFFVCLTALLLAPASLWGDDGLAGRIDAFSSNKAILYEMSDSVPGSKVLPDVIGYEFISIGIPKEKSALIPKINDWIKTMKAGGKIDPMVQRAGLRGVAH